MAKTFLVEVTVPAGLKEGDAFEIEVEMPAIVKQRGMLSGLALSDMNDEQLKREIINAKSVLYKATQRGAKEEVIAANQARVDAALEEKSLRAPAPVVKTVEAPTVESAPAEGEVHNEIPAEKNKKNKKDAEPVSTEM